MPQVDPWEKAADCERALRITIDPIHRETLSNIREFWIALAQESRFLSEDALPRHARLGPRRKAGRVLAPAAVANDAFRVKPVRHHGAGKLISAARLGPRLACPVAE